MRANTKYRQTKWRKKGSHTEYWYEEGGNVWNDVFFW